jgi:hypothetical protein
MILLGKFTNCFFLLIKFLNIFASNEGDSLFFANFFMRSVSKDADFPAGAWSYGEGNCSLETLVSVWIIIFEANL